MADSDPNVRTAASSSSSETAISTSQGLLGSCESMWESWPQGSFANSCSGAQNLTAFCQQGLLSSWLMSGFQAAEANQLQNGEEGPIRTYPHEPFARQKMFSSSPDHHQGEAGGSDSSQQLYTQTSLSPRTNGMELEERSTHFLGNTAGSALHSHRSEHDNSENTDCYNLNQQILLQMSATDLSSRTSSSSSPAASGLDSFRPRRQGTVTVEQYDSNSTKLAGVSFNSPQQASGFGAVCQQECHSNYLRGCESDHADARTFSDRSNQMYAELQNLLIKNLEVPSSQESPNAHQLVPVNHGHGSYSNWPQLPADVAGERGASNTVAAGFNHVRESDHHGTLGFSSSNALRSAFSNTRDNLSPGSGQGPCTEEVPSAVHNLRAAAAGGCGTTGLDHLDLQRKRPSSSREDVMEDGRITGVDEFAKRSCIEHHHRTLLETLQGQTLSIGVSGGNFMLGNSTNWGRGIDMHAAVGPALNTNGRPRARRGSATDPQSVYARQRRERINDRLKVLQHLVPNGARVDIVTMLEEAINYVKFLQLQVRFLSSDELWIYAPTTYNGMDVSMDMHPGLLNQQA